IPVHLTSTVSRIVGLLPGTDRTNPVPPSIRFDTAIGEGLTPAGASRDQRQALVRRYPPLRCDRHQTNLIPVGSSSPSCLSRSSKRSPIALIRSVVSRSRICGKIRRNGGGGPESSQRGKDEPVPRGRAEGLPAACPGPPQGVRTKPGRDW